MNFAAAAPIDQEKSGPTAFVQLITAVIGNRTRRRKLVRHARPSDDVCFPAEFTRDSENKQARNERANDSNPLGKMSALNWGNKNCASVSRIHSPTLPLCLLLRFPREANWKIIHHINCALIRFPFSSIGPRLKVTRNFSTACHARGR